MNTQFQPNHLRFHYWAEQLPEEKNLQQCIPNKPYIVPLINK